MADNYLERKMEDYRSGKNAIATKRHSVTATSTAKNCQISVSVPARLFIIGDDGTEPCSTLVRTFRNAGCKVAFCNSDSRFGNQLAQSSGAQFHPIDIENATKLIQAIGYASSKWGGIDALINTRITLPDELQKFLIDNDIITITIAHATDIKTTAGLCLLSLNICTEKQYR